MHMLRVESRSIDGAAEAVDLDQTPADIVALSFTDTDLSVLAAAWEAEAETLPSLRLACLSSLRHPFSTDLYLDKVVSSARFVLVRLLGGKDYWPYGVDELATFARQRGIHLAIIPGDDRVDLRLDEASTLDKDALYQISSYFEAGGVPNIGACLRFIAGQISEQATAPLPHPIESFGLLHKASAVEESDAPLALIVFYRAWMLAGDVAPVEALSGALEARGFRVMSIYVTSLKDENAAPPLRRLLTDDRPDVILNLTAFSARLDEGGSVLDLADAPVLQLALSGGGREQWAASQRGLRPADLAMSVVLPELDGRIIGGAISFKEEIGRNDALQFTRLIHQPEPGGIAHAADLAAAWRTLRRTPRWSRRLACVLSDYPAKAGRTGYAVGLDTPRSVITIADRLKNEGFAIDGLGDEGALIRALSSGESSGVISLSAYRELLEGLPKDFSTSVMAAWGDPASDAAVRDDVFHFRIVRASNLVVAVQPDRGAATSRKADYHSALVPPRHGYVAFYLWLRLVERVHAVIHCGTHGTLEWLPGKAVALSESCAPRAVLGPMPLIYPFIVNNPGEAAQAKRRTAAVTIGHLTPPLRSAGSYGAAAELEALFEEYSEAQSLDPRRASRLAELILERARETGLASESGIASFTDQTQALVRLDAWLCDLKDMCISDGLHVFGQAPDAARVAETAASIASLGGVDREAAEQAICLCAEGEMRGLLAALDGAFVQPGPAGAPARGRMDVLPTGRNLFGLDPRGLPTRTAWEIGRRTAGELVTRHVQDHGEWPRRIVLDLWGSATMRTGGDDLAQAFALMGIEPRWDTGSNRVSGFDILPLAVLGRPRIDVTLRISGLFRDVFPQQIALFDQAARAIAELDETEEDNPLAASVSRGNDGARIFGAAPGQYGGAVSRKLTISDWQTRAELGAAYLEGTSHAYGAGTDGLPAASAFRERVAEADAFVHVQDMADQDVLSADAYAEHEGGFAAAAESLGNRPALYHADTTSPDMPKIRTLCEEVARALRGRAANPAWLAGQARHGFRGAAEIAETLDNVFACAALADVVGNQQFDLLFDATLGDEAVRKFVMNANPAAARGMADRFEDAIRRGLWTTRRNSTFTILARMRSDP
jgi:cobaltochelatase CobN